MKKYFMLFPLLIISCKKEPKIPEKQDMDSTVVTEQTPPVEKTDSAALRIKDSIVNNAPKTKEVLRRGVMRTEDDEKIIRTADADQLPFTVGETISKDNQEFILKITNFNKSTLKAKITKKEKDFNIRFNQIRLPNGDYDGPFGTELTYDVKGKGEVWLIIGKSNMASGNTKGNFTVSVE